MDRSLYYKQPRVARRARKPRYRFGFRYSIRYKRCRGGMSRDWPLQKHINGPRYMLGFRYSIR
jgi:hypothetical protein